MIKCTGAYIKNPRRACAARVTVYTSLSRTILGLQATRRFSATRAKKLCGDLAETTPFERYGVKTSQKANMHWLGTRFSPGLASQPYFSHAHARKNMAGSFSRFAFSAHRHHEPTRTHDLAVRMRIMRIIVPRIYRMRIANKVVPFIIV